MKKSRKLLCIFLTLAMLLALVSGCGSTTSSAAESTDAQALSAESDAAPQDANGAEDAEETEDSEEAAEDQAEASEVESAMEIPEAVDYFPLEEPQSISYWVQLNPEASSLITDLADTPGYQYLAEKLNVTFDFTCVATAAATEQFGLMIASRDYCDILDGIVNVFGGGYTGGPTKAYEDDVIIDLSEYLYEYCPNYLNLLNETGQMVNAKIDTGEILVFYPIYEEFNTLTGVTIRNDLLKALNMDVPVTYDDYAEFGRAVKSEFGISDPIYLSSDTNSWVMGYNVTGFAASTDGTGTDHIFQKDGKVTSSFLEEDYKAYLELMNSWYEEGIISPAFTERTSNIKSQDMERMILNGELGVFPNDANSMLNHEGMSAIEDMDLVGAGWPMLTEDTTIHVSNSLDNLQQMGAVCISSCCENFELVFRFMDQFYTEDAMMLNAYGVPDLYEIDAEGNITYTDEANDLFENNEWGTTSTNAKGFFRAGIAGMKTQQDQFLNWGLDSDETAAVHIWNSERYDDKWLMPSTLSLTTEESSTIAEKSSDIATYAAETVARFITGEKSFDEWDAFVEQLMSMDLQDVIDAYQSAMDRYNER